jgi:hypothetical protein
MIGLWPGMPRFLDDALPPLHNDLGERELKGVVGRKNRSPASSLGERR